MLNRRAIYASDPRPEAVTGRGRRSADLRTEAHGYAASAQPSPNFIVYDRRR
jgi:hypothetical protein